jgi:uncharacterized protein with PIN domain
MGNSTTRKKAASIRQRQIRAKRSWLAPEWREDPAFIADVMLGRLAKWLRIAGFDVLYSNRFSDDELIAISNREGRVLLSRDTRLLIRKSVRDFIFLESQDVQAQIIQVFKTMHILNLPLPLTRCLSCNEELVEIERDSVRGRVPAFVYETQTHFRSCPQCKKIFWAGTHRRSVIRTLRKLLPDTSESHEALR